MKRLIDANELMWHKSLLVEPRDRTVSAGRPISDDELYAYRLGWNDAIDAIMNEAPTVDAVEVIRCKDCKYCDRGNCDFWDDGYGAIVSMDDFCSQGERKKDE